MHRMLHTGRHDRRERSQKEYGSTRSRTQGRFHAKTAEDGLATEQAQNGKEAIEQPGDTLVDADKTINTSQKERPQRRGRTEGIFVGTDAPHTGGGKILCES